MGCVWGSFIRYFSGNPECNLFIARYVVANDFAAGFADVQIVRTYISFGRVCGCLEKWVTTHLGTDTVTGIQYNNAVTGIQYNNAMAVEHSKSTFLWAC